MRRHSNQAIVKIRKNSIPNHYNELGDITRSKVGNNIRKHKRVLTIGIQRKIKIIIEGTLLTERKERQPY
jgi:hypothetical protein